MEEKKGGHKSKLTTDPPTQIINHVICCKAKKKRVSKRGGGRKRRSQRYDYHRGTQPVIMSARFPSPAFGRGRKQLPTTYRTCGSKKIRENQKGERSRNRVRSDRIHAQAEDIKSAKAAQEGDPR